MMVKSSQVVGLRDRDGISGRVSVDHHTISCLFDADSALCSTGVNKPVADQMSYQS